MHVALINNVSIISVLRRWFFVALTGWCQPTSCNSWRNWGATPHKPCPVTIQGPQGSHVKHHQGAKNLNEWRGFRNQQPAACKPFFYTSKKQGSLKSLAEKMLNLKTVLLDPRRTPTAHHMGQCCKVWTPLEKMVDFSCFPRYCK